MWANGDCKKSTERFQDKTQTLSVCPGTVLAAKGFFTETILGGCKKRMP